MDGVIPVTVGTRSNVNWSATRGGLRPLGVTTARSTVPDWESGASASMSSSLRTEKLDAGVDPNNTLVAFVNPVPLSVTAEPPRPAAGATDPTDSGGVS